MANPQDRKAYDKAEETAHRIEDGNRFLEQSGRIKPEMAQPIHAIQWPSKGYAPPEFLIVAKIKAGLWPDGVFRAESKCGAEIAIRAGKGGELTLVVENEDEPFVRVWVLRCK